MSLLALLVGAPSDGLVLLYVLPVGFLALCWGAVGGLAAGALSCGLLVLWAALDHVGLGPVGYLTHGAVYLATGLAVGYAAERRHGAAGDDSRFFEMSNDLLVEASLDGYFTRLSERWETCLGWTREELMARPFREFVHPDDLAATNRYADALEVAPGEVINFENRYRAKDGSYRWLMWYARSDNERKYAVARDVTDRKLLEQQRTELLARVEELARTDSLTGLPNRRAWDEELRRELASSERYGRLLAVALIDLDDFKAFNDSRGHAAGDLLLTEAASAWREALRATDFLARYGGEEFAVLLPECPLGEAQGLLERLRAATPDGQTCSVGIAQWERGDTAERILAKADAAMYEAKRRGRDRVVVAG